MSRVTITEWYERVEAVWDGVELPRLTGREAIRAARGLYRNIIGGRAPAAQVTNGNSYSWLYSDGLRVNPGRGWDKMVHDLSHAFHRKLNPEERPHGGVHARLEIRMRKEVLRRGWLSGKLKPPPAPAPEERTPAEVLTFRREARLDNVRAREARWKTKLKRAQTALRKLARQRRGLERALKVTP